MPDDPIAPGFPETHARATFHLREAGKALTARYPVWAGKRPTGLQRGAMRRAARLVNRALRQLDQVAPGPEGPDANDTTV